MWQEQELQREVSVLLGKLEAQGQETAGLQHHRAQARELTAALHSTTDALERSHAELQQTASDLEHTRQRLAQARTPVPAIPLQDCHVLCCSYDPLCSLLSILSSHRPKGWSLCSKAECAATHSDHLKGCVFCSAT